MKEWLDGWVNGQMNGRMDGWKDRLVGNLLDGETRRVDEWVGKVVDQQGTDKFPRSQVTEPF